MFENNEVTDFKKAYNSDLISAFTSECQGGFSHYDGLSDNFRGKKIAINGKVLEVTGDEEESVIVISWDDGDIPSLVARIESLEFNSEMPRVGNYITLFGVLDGTFTRLELLRGFVSHPFLIVYTFTQIDPDIDTSFAVSPWKIPQRIRISVFIPI